MLKNAGLTLAALVLFVASLSNAQSVRYIDSFFWGEMVDVAVQGNYAYCALANGLEIIDICDTMYECVGRVYLPGEAIGVDVAGDFVYIADNAGGLQIINASDKSNPFKISEFKSGRNIRDVKLFGNYAFLANGWGMAIIDITDPYQPTFINSYILPTSSNFIAVDQLFAYVLSFWNDLYIYDCSDPYNPEVISGIPTPGYSDDLFVSDTLLFIADDASGTQIYNVSWPRQPEFISNIPTAWYSVGVSSIDTFLYVVEIWDGLQTYNIADPSSPQLLSVYDTPGTAWKVDIQENHAYIVDSDFGLFGADLSNPANPEEAGSFRSGSPIWDMVKIGDYVYMIDNGLKILNVADPLHPQIVTQYDPGGWQTHHSLEVNNGTAYSVISVNGDIGNIAIIDVSNPLEPRELDIYRTAVYARDITIQGNYAFFVGEGIEIVDISDPSIPLQVGLFEASFWATGAEIQGNYLYLACGYSGVQIFDISDPVNPQPLGMTGPDYYSYKLRVRDNYAYVADRGMLVQVIDISDPNFPNIVGVYDVPGSNNLYSIELQGNYALVGGYYSSNNDIHGNIFVLNISNPQNPSFVGGYYSPGYAYTILPLDDYFYVGTSNSLMLLQFDPTSTNDDGNSMLPGMISLFAYPNPFNSSTTISTNSNYVGEIEIYDISGRKITKLAVTGGNAIWDATNYSSGIYFATLRDSQSSAIKLILLK